MNHFVLAAVTQLLYLLCAWLAAVTRERAKGKRLFRVTGSCILALFVALLGFKFAAAAYGLLIFLSWSKWGGRAAINAQNPLVAPSPDWAWKISLWGGPVSMLLLGLLFVHASLFLAISTILVCVAFLLSADRLDRRPKANTGASAGNEN